MGTVFRSLSVRERAVLLVSAIALLVAVICFGLFASTGTFQYGGYTIGGTFVGFLGTVAVLTRLYLQAGGTLINPKERAGANFSVENTTKFLDLRPYSLASGRERGQSQDAGDTEPVRATFYDWYEGVTKETDEESVMTFSYATTGRELVGESESHSNANWVDKTIEQPRVGEDVHLGSQAHRYDLEVDLTKLAVGEQTQIINRAVFVDAFEGMDKEWFHTHIDYPTGALTIVLIFPPDRPCLIIKGLSRASSRKHYEEVTKGRPLLLEDGQIVSWRILKPELGVEYQLEWTWARRETGGIDRELEAVGT